MRRSTLGRYGAGAGLLAALAAAGLLTACDESLLPGPDRDNPRAEVLAPSADARIDPGAALRVTARASDDQGVKELTLSVVGSSGEALYQSVTVDFGSNEAAPRNIEVIRDLQPVTGAAASGEARVIATVTDFSERTGADTVRVLLQAEGGGNVEIGGAGVYFSFTAPARLEVGDSVAVTVSASSKAGVREVGATLLAILRGAKPDTLTLQSQRVGASAATFRFGLDAATLARLQPMLAQRDSVGVRLEVNGFAVDGAGTCVAASAPDTLQTLACRAGAGGATFAPSAGAAKDVLFVRGSTLLLGATGDRLADLAWDAGRRRLFASNQTRNVLEVLNPGELRFNATSRIAVGSEPWGLALGKDGTTIFVANSGGTNISAVSLGTLKETGRIQTPNVLLFDVTFTTDSVDVNGVKEWHMVPSGGTKYDYSDRPQFIAQTTSGELLFSTKPTGTASDGTIRRLTPPAGNDGLAKTELFIEYAKSDLLDRVGIVNALDVRLTVADPKKLVVWPRSCPGGNAAAQGFVEQVDSILRQRGCDTKFIYGLDVTEVGLSDTTFVAMGGNRRSVAFGEGARGVGRVLLFEDRGSGRFEPTSSNVRDLTLNAADRVSGLALNADGSLGVARGAKAYFFNDDLRLQGMTSAGQASGGVALHPAQSGLDGLAFISGVDAASELPFVDVVDVRNFARRRRIVVRDAVIGSLIATTATGADQQAGAQITLYGITASGVVKINLTASDLTGS